MALDGLALGLLCLLLLQSPLRGFFVRLLLHPTRLAKRLQLYHKLAVLLAGHTHRRPLLLHLALLLLNAFCRIVSAVRPAQLAAFQVMVLIIEHHRLQFFLLIRGLHPDAVPLHRCHQRPRAYGLGQMPAQRILHVQLGRVPLQQHLVEHYQGGQLSLSQAHKKLADVAFQPLY